MCRKGASPLSQITCIIMLEAVRQLWFWGALTGSYYSFVCPTWFLSAPAADAFGYTRPSADAGVASYIDCLPDLGNNHLKISSDSVSPWWIFYWTLSSIPVVPCGLLLASFLESGVADAISDSLLRKKVKDQKNVISLLKIGVGKVHWDKEHAHTNN